MFLDPLTIGAISVALIFVLILAGFHVGVALAAVSFIGVYLITGRFNVAAGMLGSTAFHSIANYNFAVIPLFVVMGIFANLSGATRNLFDAAEFMTRRIRGGVGVSTVIANAVFAAITGVSVASAAVFTKLAVPQMLRLGYSRKFSLGIVASSSILGMLIPPSVLMIVYGILTEDSIGRLFAAGILPGLLVAAILCVAIVLRVRWNPALAGIDEGTGPAGGRSGLSLLLRTWPIVALIVLVLGGIYGGVFTPTEAGAVGALGGLILVAIHRQLTGRSLIETLLETGKITASVFFLLICAQMYGRMLTLSRLPDALTDAVTQLAVPGIALIFIFVVVIMLLGCIIDSVSILLLTVPIMLPVVEFLGYDTIWFGIVTILAVELGLLTPPFGMVVFSMKAAAPEDVGIEEIFRGSAPFFFLLLLALVVVVLVPELSLFLPAYFYG